VSSETRFPRLIRAAATRSPGEASPGPETTRDSLARGDDWAEQRVATRLAREPVRGNGHTPVAQVQTVQEGDAGSAVLREFHLYKRTLAVADVCAATVAILVAVSIAPHAQLTIGVVAALPAIVLLAETMGLYYRDRHVMFKTTLEEIPHLFHVATLYALLVWLGQTLVLDGTLQRAGVVALWAALLALLVVARSVTRTVLRRLAPAERCLVVGDAKTAAALQRKLDLSFAVKGKIVGRVPIVREPARRRRAGASGPPVLGRLEGLERTLVEHRVQRVIVVPSRFDELTLEAIRIVKATGVNVSLLPRMLDVVGSSFEPDDLDGTTLLGIRSSRLTRTSATLKRTLDVVGALICLVAMAPVMAVIASAVKLTSSGPVLYRQKRIGRGGEEFEMLKFRSMVDGADAQKAMLHALNETEGLFKIADDPRVTRVGRLLRRSSLDELPQLWNVIRGEMSLVGPRPLVPDDDVKIEGWQRGRLTMRPGMTGPWQILGSTRVPLQEMVKLDYLYGANWSLWLDLKILLRTVAYVANRRSA
jgi:exopolysaccharide biosynthesis polyprenyl glycosylphosphotransferase